jgi:hypothetical protein
MFKEYRLPLTRKNPPKATVTADIRHEESFSAQAYTFNHDFLATDGELHLTLNTLQTYVTADGIKVERGIEFVFDADITTGLHAIQNRKVSAAYWKMWREGDKLRVQTFGADTGSVDLEFDHENERYDGKFHFRSLGVDGEEGIDIDSGRFSISGRNDIAL